MKSLRCFHAPSCSCGDPPPLPSALAGVTAEELREIADYISCEAECMCAHTKAAAILRALADTIEKTEGKP